MQFSCPLKSLMYALLLLPTPLLAQKSVKESQPSSLSITNESVAEHTFTLDSVRSVLLDEVRIESKQKSPKEKLEEAKQEYRDAYIKGTYNKHLKLRADEKTKSTTLTLLNLDMAYKRFSKSGKNARKLQRSIQYDYEQAEIDYKYTSQLVKNLTGLEGNDLVYFMQQNRPTYALISQGADYDLIIFIKKSYANYRPNSTLLSDLPLEPKIESK